MEGTGEGCGEGWKGGMKRRDEKKGWRNWM